MQNKTHHCGSVDGLHNTAKTDLEAFMDNHIHKALVLDRFNKPIHMFSLLNQIALINFPRISLSSANNTENMYEFYAYTPKISK